MSNINKQELRRTSDRDWFEDWFKREFHPDKTGPYIKDQLFFAVLAARAPLLDELEAAEKRIADQCGIIASARKFISEYAGLGDVGAAEFIKIIDRAAAAGKGEAS